MRGGGKKDEGCEGGRDERRGRSEGVREGGKKDEEQGEGERGRKDKDEEGMRDMWQEETTRC